jgi:hypothetical protein
LRDQGRDHLIRLMRANAATLVLLALAGCSRPSATTPDASGPELASATAFVDSFLASLAHPDYTGDAVRFDTAGFAWARSGALIDADSLTRLLRAQRAAGKSIVLGTNDVQLTPIAPDAVVWSGIVSGVAKDSTGERAIRGALTLVLRRRAGAWFIAAGHESVRPFDDVHEAGAAPPR